VSGGRGDGDGEFYFSGGKRPDKAVLKEMLEFLDSVHEDLNELPNDDEDPQSVGEYFKTRFEVHIEEEKDEKTRAEMESIFQWFIEWEKVDTGVANLDLQSVPSWGEYVDYDLEGDEAEPILENGYVSLVNHVRENIGERVRFQCNSRVKEIRWRESPIQIVLENYQDIVEVDHVIVSVSLGVLKNSRNLFNPSLPEQKEDAIAAMGFGVMNKILLGFQEPFWNRDSGDEANSTNETTSLGEGGIQFLWHKSEKSSALNGLAVPSDHWTKCIPGFDIVFNQPNVLCGWICGEKALEIEKLSNEEVLNDCWDLLKSKVGPEVPRPIYVNPSRWGSNINFQGSYSYRTPACDVKNIGPWTLEEPLLIDGIARVQFCGEATCSSGYGTVHGALQSGGREARRLVNLYK